MKITIEQLEFTLCIKEKINKIPNKKQSKFNKDKYPLLQIPRYGKIMSIGDDNVENKIFLYLYPIQEFNKVFLFSNDFYEEMKREKPFDVLNECINERYRKKGYQIVYALYPDKEIFGITPMPNDRIIYTDITFKETSGYNEDGIKKEAKDIKYPNEQYLINQLGFVDEIVIGGFHFSDCVKRVAECCLENGMDTLVDLDLTDLFFSLYYQKNYFKIDEYSPERYKKYWQQKASRYGENIDFIETRFRRMYGSPVYRFYANNEITRKK